MLSEEGKDILNKYYNKQYLYFENLENIYDKENNSESDLWTLFIYKPGDKYFTVYNREVWYYFGIDKHYRFSYRMNIENYKKRDGFYYPILQQIFKWEADRFKIDI